MTTHRNDSALRRAVDTARRVYADLDRASRAMFELPDPTRR